MSKEYAYTSLESEEIRLLELHAGEEDADLQGSLHVFRLPVEDEPTDELELFMTRATGVPVPNAPPYDALSYVWGDVVRLRHQIKISQEGKLRHVPIKPNLYDALMRLRKDIEPDGTKMIWVDSVCINQNDIPEKNQQIQKMAMIYNRAERVAVWLGNEDKDSRRAIEFIDRLLRLEDFDLVSNESGSTIEWAALHNLMQRPWFNRRWIVQEISLARTATLFCGGHSVSWLDFSAAVALFVARYRDLRPLFQRSVEFHNHPNYLGEVEALGARSLVDITANLFRKSDEGVVLERVLSLEAVISTLTLFEASNPHDTIYSVLWLAHDAEPDSKERYAMAQSQLVRTPIGSPELDHAPSPIGSDSQQHFISSPDSSRALTSLAESGYFSTAGEKALESASQMPQSQVPETQRDGFLKPPIRLKRSSTRSATDHTLKSAESQFEAKPYSIMVDYDTDIYIVFRQFLDFAMSRSRSLDIICHPWAPEPLPSEPELPSWIPLLSSAPFDKKPGSSAYGRVRADSLVGLPGIQRNYNASGKTKMYPSKGFIRGRSLIATGFVLDAIKVRKSAAVEGIIPSGWIDLAGWSGAPDPVPDRFWRTLVADRGPGGQKYPPAYFALACKWVLERRPRRGNINTNEILMFGQCPSIATEFLHRVQSVVWDRMLVLTEGRKGSKQLLALVPKEAEQGDLICILYGCSVPVVLRRSKKRRAVRNEDSWGRESTKTTSSRGSSSHPDPFRHLTNPRVSFSRASSTSHQSDVEIPGDPEQHNPDDSETTLPVPWDSQEQYTFIGECYVHGMMAGEGSSIARTMGTGYEHSTWCETRGCAKSPIAPSLAKGYCTVLESAQRIYHRPCLAL